MKEYDLSVNKELRDTCMERVEVLDKVKKLFLIPGMEVMTTKQVAEYFEVDVEAIQKTYQRNKEEIDSDGTIFKKPSEFRGDNMSSLKSNKRGISLFELPDGNTLEVQNYGTRCFSQRAILRIAMLLRDSVIAKEVRTQLLNTFENASIEDKTYAIEEEELLYLNMAKAIMSGDTASALQAMCEVQQYQNRHIDALTKENEDLTTVNKLLSDGVNTWDNKAVLNAMVRAAAVNSFEDNFGKAWGSYYKQLQYKQGICLSSRNGDGSKLSKIRPGEWTSALQVGAAWLMDMGIDVIPIINSVNTTLITK